MLCVCVWVKVEYALNKITVHEVVSFGGELQTMFPMPYIAVEQVSFSLFLNEADVTFLDKLMFWHYRANSVPSLKNQFVYRSWDQWVMFPDWDQCFLFIAVFQLCWLILVYLLDNSLTKSPGLIDQIPELF